MRTIEKRCTECLHAVRDPNATPDQVIAGQVQHLCLYGPPTTVGIATARGVALMTSYPIVTKDTISCGCFARETPAVATPSGFRCLNMNNMQNGG